MHQVHLRSTFLAFSLDAYPYQCSVVSVHCTGINTQNGVRYASKNSLTTFMNRSLSSHCGVWLDAANFTHFTRGMALKKWCHHLVGHVVVFSVDQERGYVDEMQLVSDTPMVLQYGISPGIRHGVKNYTYYSDGKKN